MSVQSLRARGVCYVDENLGETVVIETDTIGYLAKSRQI